MTLTWRNSMSVGGAEFDEDHQRMLLLHQEIEAAVAAGGAAHAHAPTVKLLALAGDHTSREEAFLRRIGFPGLDTWIAAKKDTLSRIATLKHAIPGEDPIGSPPWKTPSSPTFCGPISTSRAASRPLDTPIPASIVNGLPRSFSPPCFCVFFRDSGRFLDSWNPVNYLFVTAVSLANGFAKRMERFRRSYRLSLPAHWRGRFWSAIHWQSRRCPISCLVLAILALTA